MKLKDEKPCDKSATRESSCQMGLIDGGVNEKETENQIVENHSSIAIVDDSTDQEQALDSPLHHVALHEENKELFKVEAIGVRQVRDQDETDINDPTRKSIAKDDTSEHALPSTESHEKEELLQRIKQLESQIERDQQDAILAKRKVAFLEQQAEDTEKAHRSEMEATRMSFEAEIKRFKESLRELSEVEEAMHLFEAEVKELNSKLEESNRKHQEELESCRHQHSDEMDSHRRQLFQSGREAMNRIKSLEQEIVQLHKRQEEAETQKNLSPEAAEVLKADVAAAKSRLDLHKKSFEDSWESIRADHTKKRDVMLLEFNDVLMQLKTEHAKEYEGVLAELTKAESEYKTRFADVQMRAGIKHAIIKFLELWLLLLCFALSLFLSNKWKRSGSLDVA